MKWNRRQKNTVVKAIQSASVSHRAVVEPLEQRQLLSVTIDLRTSTGGKTVTVTQVGQVVHLELYAVVSGKLTGDNDGFQSTTGSLIGTPTSSGSVIGDLSGNVTDDYTANGASNGTQVDLNGDGGLDVGSNNNEFINGFFFPRAGGPMFDGVVSGNTQTFDIASVTYTVTKLNSGAPTDINFRKRIVVGGAYEAVWVEDDMSETDESATLQIGSPVVVSNGQAVTKGSISGTIDKVVGGVTSGFSGVTMYLDANTNGKLDSGEVTTTSSSTGTYSFSGLSAGTYHVREVIPTGYTQNAPSPVVTLAAGQAATGADFTDTAIAKNTGSISGTINKVVSGVTSPFAGVTMYIDTNTNGKLDSGETTTTSSSNGTFTFSGLAAGTYHVREVIPSGYTQNAPSPVVTLSAGQAATGANFADTAIAKNSGSISGTIDKIVSGVTSAFSGVTMYIDTNNNGKLDSGETTTTSSSTGTFTFSGLAAGTYHVREVIPSGYTQNAPSPVVTLSAGQAATGANFTDTSSAAPKTGSISGYIFADTNSDGKWENTEKAVAGVTVYIDTNKNGVKDSGEASAVTGSNGEFTFANLNPGTYRIREVVPAGKKETTVAYYDVTLTAGQIITNKNFGNA